MIARRTAAAVVAAALLAGCTPGSGADRPVASGTPTHAHGSTHTSGTHSGSSRPSSRPASTPSSAATGEPTRPAAPAGSASDALRLRTVTRITGSLSSKSVVASGHGVVFAQNMMYRHTISVLDVRTHRIAATISDAVDLRALGATTAPAGVHNGAPVEATFTRDGKYAYVSNYSMYGAGFGPEGSDTCPAHVYDDSYVYRVDVAKRRIDQAIRVGSVPKFLAITPDGRQVVVSNWCDYSVSVIDTATARTVREVPVGRFPRGVAITADSSTAYIAVMGSTQLAVLDLRSYAVHRIDGVGSAPRHVVLSPDGRWLYVTVNGDGVVEKLDTRSRRVVARIRTGSQPRSMTIAPDGRSIYVVNYASNTVTKVRTRDMAALQTIRVDEHPIGITYVPESGEIWVACYSGSILVFKDA
jgi:YVTN family beta-propeller protein